MKSGGKPTTRRERRIEVRRAKPTGRWLGVWRSLKLREALENWLKMGGTRPRKIRWGTLGQHAEAMRKRTALRKSKRRTLKALHRVRIARGQNARTGGRRR